ncbi:UNVERIFIED_CONTAM: hypothetical protein Scaly_1080900 [Sesamum calycinum]|uniref:Reverse transcriptase Ty1/copia-type domain-containing protein n=1 Tax=Sesamum calycinum TaxID=2727403 RepID=A0AAW2QM92_9LAMI
MSDQISHDKLASYDVLLIGNDANMLGGIKVWLSMQFSIKDLGETSYILGIKIYKSTKHHVAYTLRVASRCQGFIFKLIGGVVAWNDRVNSAENRVDPLTKPVSHIAILNILERWV